MHHHGTPIPNLSLTLIDYGRLQLLDVLGAGAFGTVYRAHDRDFYGSPVFRAVKVMPLVLEGASELAKIQERECSNHGYVSGHPNIVKLHRVVRDSKYIYVVLDYITGGDLHSIICAHRLARNDELIKLMLLQLVDAVYACHQNNIYHRDLKPDNILVSENPRSLYLGDFGLSTRSSGRSYMFRVGTANFMSPECYNHQGKHDDYDLRRNDIWAIGMIAVCMVTGRCPWRRPSLKDDNYRYYVEDQCYFRTMLPISAEGDDILRRVFTLKEEDCIDLLELRQLIATVKTFYMPKEELETAHPSAKEIYDEYEPYIIEGLTLLGDEDDESSIFLSPSADVSSDSEYSEEYPTDNRVRVETSGAPCSNFVNQSELPGVPLEDSPAPPALEPPPLPLRRPVQLPDDVLPLPPRTFTLGSACENPSVFTLGTAGSCSTCLDSRSESSEEDSDEPVTPETHAQNPNIAVSEIEDGGLGQQAASFEPVFEKVQRGLTGPQFRVLGGLIESVTRMLTTA